MLNGERVRLITDLTSYKPGLIVGVEGTVCDPTTMWGRMGAVGVVFDNGQQLDVFPKSLEIIPKPIFYTEENMKAAWNAGYNKAVSSINEDRFDEEDKAPNYNDWLKDLNK